MNIKNYKDNHYALIKKNVMRFLAKGPNSFKNILLNSDGLFPLDLIYVLDNMISDSEIILKKKLYSLSRDIGIITINKSTDLELHLPPPHLHDCDWRFTKSTIEYICEEILVDICETNHILLLGAPTILVGLLQYDPIPNIHLIDSNISIIDFFKKTFNTPKISVHCLNLLINNWKFNNQIEKVFLDPPWYPEYYAAFLIQASLVTDIGSTVNLVLPAINTRHTAYNERWKILDISRQLGFSIKSLKSGIIEYETPEFEKSSIKFHNIDGINDWRVADLITLKKFEYVDTKIINRIRKDNVKKFDGEEWFEIIINNYKIKIKGPFNDYHIIPKLISIEENNVLPSVSRRYVNRKNIDLWLSDNRVFKVEGHAAFLYALLSMADKKTPNHLKDISQINFDAALRYLREIL